MPRILFIDDHPLYRSGVQLALQRTLPDFGVYLSGSAEEALSLLEGGLDVDLCLTDVRLPVMDGLSLAVTIAERWPTVARALISAEPSPEMASRARRAGCIGLLSKARDMPALGEALRDLFSGVEVFDERASAGPGLTAKRLEVLQLAAGGMTNKAIAREMGIAERSVKDHWKAIFRRLDVATRAEAVSQAHQRQLI